ncbi:hypothetical protein HYV83_02560 [Candidatus Woesearchaeota archaeon]|nr:hypothetical protein [Candidatus Woesearchaeota archaeon]
MKMLLSAKRGALTGKKAVALILLVVGVMLMFFIISQGVSIYKSSREGTDERTGAARCVGYLYTISGITATDEELQFTFRNEGFEKAVVRCEHTGWLVNGCQGACQG